MESWHKKVFLERSCAVRALFHVLGDRLLSIADCNMAGRRVCHIRPGATEG